MKFLGIIKMVMPARTGVSSRGEWMSQTYWIEDASDKVLQGCVFDVSGEDKIKQFDLQQGRAYEVEIDLNVREYAKKDGTTGYFNSLQAWRVTPLEQQTTPAATTANVAPDINVASNATSPAGRSKPSAYRPNRAQVEAMTHEKEQELIQNLTKELEDAKKRMAATAAPAPAAHNDDLPF